MAIRTCISCNNDFVASGDEKECNSVMCIKVPDEPKQSILSEREKHYLADGIWHPMVLDTMGDWTPEFIAQWCEEQRQERQALIDAGEPVNK